MRNLIKFDNKPAQYGGLMGRPPTLKTSWIYILPLMILGSLGFKLFNLIPEPTPQGTEMMYLDTECFYPDTMETTKVEPVAKAEKKKTKKTKKKKEEVPVRYTGDDNLRAMIAKDLEDGWRPQTRMFPKKQGRKRKFDETQSWVVNKNEMMKLAPDMIVEEILYGVPASITIAQLDVEALWFKSNLALKTNNGFGIKHVKRWDKNPELWLREYRDGHVVAYDDYPTDKFIKFKSKWASIRFHTKFLALLQYKVLLKGEYSFDKWAYGLKRFGYATDKNYVKTLKSRYHMLDLSYIEKVAKKYKNYGTKTKRENVKLAKIGK